MHEPRFQSLAHSSDPQIPAQARPSVFRDAIAWTISVWSVQVVLRVAVLARPDGLGHPFVGKFHWYFFHAICFDARWTLLAMAPFAAHAWFWGKRSPRWARAGLWAAMMIQSLILLLTVSDHELQRFMGARLTPSFLFTYNSLASLREVWNFLMDDRGVRGLGLVLFFGCVPATLAVWKFTKPTVARHPGAWIIGALAFVVVGDVYTQIVWTGGFREAKLAPIPKLWINDWREQADEVMTDREFRALSARWSRTWLSEAGSDTGWTFPDSNLPLWRMPRGGERLVPVAQRRNIVLVIIETGRALNCGFLMPYGAMRDATPFLDSIAPLGRVWARHSVTTLPTVRALMSIHLGIPDNPVRTIATAYPRLANRSLPNILREHGWRTRFFSAADPAWDNEPPWLERWYDSYDYSSSREHDGEMFAHASRWMSDSLRDGKPFFVTLMTKSNHYPFDQFGKWKKETDLQKRHMVSMRYTDSCLGAFVKSLRREPWFSKTIFVVTGDHGFPLGEHGSALIGFGLYDESTWIPLVAWGPHPGLGHGVDLRPSTHMDLAPTLLHLAGVRAANHFMGHDLLDSVSASRIIWATHGDELMAANQLWRGHGTLSGAPRERGLQLFGLADPLETRDSIAAHRPQRDSLLEEGRFRTRLDVGVLGRNALAPLPRR